MKKFWKKVEVKEIFTNTFQVRLDNKILKTPMKKDLRFLNYQRPGHPSLPFTYLLFDMMHHMINQNMHPLYYF